MGVVGAARVGGEIATLDIPASQQLAMFVMLLGGFNLSLFLFNMLPLLPLDGGHIAGALWESLRRNLARLLRRPDPGPSTWRSSCPSPTSWRGSSSASRSSS